MKNACISRISQIRRGVWTFFSRMFTIHTILDSHAKNTKTTELLMEVVPELNCQSATKPNKPTSKQNKQNKNPWQCLFYLFSDQNTTTKIAYGLKNIKKYVKIRLTWIFLGEME